MRSDLDRWKELHHADVEIETNALESVIFWTCVGVWMMLIGYYVCEWIFN